MTLRNRNVLRLQTIQTTSLTRWLWTSYHAPSSFSVLCRWYCICIFVRRRFYSCTVDVIFVLFYTLEILDCSSPAFNIKKLEDDRCKEPRRRHSLYTEQCVVIRSFLHS
jgi:hypothetical protein